MEAIMQSPNASSLEEFPHPNPLLEKVIKLVDLIYEARGLNVPQVMEFEQLRTLPPGSFGRA
jgi:ubiquinone biosynthesis protein COQ4